ncbi:DUF305 domain-containing protein [Streptomyces sp. NPDC003758]|uniref:DUF305 domain-containing protein n=1 Tax=Streptomyces cynarae TaxID=2981134 RepID=A0ABY6DZQ2_9ACTN|nr:DUF305 domain-containing protein [Streptomyces cynarae]UXY19623.1 DUF305 domain-containing protein [Streptomyces cynarae]
MAFRRSSIRRTVAAAAAAAAAVVLTACGGSDSSSSPSASSSASSGHSGHGMGSMSPAAPSGGASAAQGGHNAQDVAFAQDMIPHHRQAVAMAGLAPSRASSPDVKDLAARIRKAQDPEIATMSGWLKAWGEKVPEGSGSGMESMPGMDHSGSSMPGMMSDGDMKKLQSLSGVAFDKAFLQMMIGHHEGAIAMARTEGAKGAYDPAQTMAKSIVTSQSAEITEMKKMLGER